MEQSITLEEARSIAKRVCQEQGWAFFEPISIESEKNCWFIRTNSEALGCNAVILVSKATK